MVSFISLILNPWIVFGISLAIAISIIIILTIIEKILSKKVAAKTDKEQNIYKNKLDELKELKTEPEKKLKDINIVARNLFQDRFNINKKFSYSEILEKLKEKNSPKITEFSQKMIGALYAGEKIDQIKINYLLKLLMDIQEKSMPKPKTDEAIPKKIISPVSVKINEKNKFKKILIEKKPRESLFKKIKNFFISEKYLMEKISNELKISNTVKKTENKNLTKIEYSLPKRTPSENKITENQLLSSTKRENINESIEKIEIPKIKNPEVIKIPEKITLKKIKYKKSEEEKLMNEIDNLERIKEKIDERKKFIQ